MEKTTTALQQQIDSNPARTEQKLSLLSLRLTRQQREKLTRLGGTAWLRRQIDSAVLPGQIPEAADLEDQCQCKNTSGNQCHRPAEMDLTQIIDGQRHIFKVCHQHHKAFQHGTLSVGDKRKTG